MVKSIAKNKAAEILNAIATVAFVAAVCIAIIVYNKQSCQGIINGIKTCAYTLVPSLLPFMFFSNFVVICGLSERIEPLVNKLTGFLFYLPGCTAPTIILSLIGGYPVGANNAKKLYENNLITKEQFERMMCFCISSGPAFIINIVGQKILNSYNIGLYLFLVQIAIALTIGIILGIIARIKNKNTPFGNRKVKTKNINLSSAIIESCQTASENLIVMCVLIVLFFSVIEIFKYQTFTFFGHNRLALPFAISCAEITNFCTNFVTFRAPLWLMGWAVGYGGICAHMQVFSILNNTNLNFKKIEFFRVINGIISAVFAYLVINALKIDAEVFSNLQNPIIEMSYKDYINSAALILLCVCFTAETNIQKSRSKIC